MIVEKTYGYRYDQPRPVRGHHGPLKYQDYMVKIDDQIFRVTARRGGDAAKQGMKTWLNSNGYPLNKLPRLKFVNSPGIYSFTPEGDETIYVEVIR